ncbi:hypothetical protein D3C87_1412720 [compost metagenome]
MQAKQKIFIVQHLETDDIYAIFDEYSKAEAYVHRFKTKAYMEIVAHVLNPEYLSDKTRDPYNVVLPKTGAKPIELCIYTNAALIEAAFNEEYSIHQFEEEDVDTANIDIQLMAPSETDALIRAIAIRDEVIIRYELDCGRKRYGVFTQIPRFVKKMILLNM